MNSYIAIALVLCIAVAQVQSQATRSGTASPGRSGQNAALMAALSSMGSRGGGMSQTLPLMAMMNGNDNIRNMLFYNLLMRGGNGGRSPMGSLGNLMMFSAMGEGFM
ncbi:uncharacterized protein LOC117343445 isoform X4 [Pecten maximus]|uniref:uncharacterized protein LOC117343445 isoform X4 n=1 Tax=Pecten maximus TaxID=6579 RepID=UPI0014584EE3|nr:uncharacterized protein LOC117343445 isoform X4 [Pecten maximus]